MERNFGTIARLTEDRACRAVGYRAGRHRKDLGEVNLTDWRIVGVRDEAPAITEVDVVLDGTHGDRQWSGKQTMRLIFCDEKFEMRVRGAPDGKWAIMPNFLQNICGNALASILKKRDK